MSHTDLIFYFFFYSSFGCWNKQNYDNMKTFSKLKTKLSSLIIKDIVIQVVNYVI